MDTLDREWQPCGSHEVLWEKAAGMQTGKREVMVIQFYLYFFFFDPR